MKGIPFYESKGFKLQSESVLKDYPEFPAQINLRFSRKV